MKQPVPRPCCHSRCAISAIPCLSCVFSPEAEQFCRFA